MRTRLLFSSTHHLVVINRHSSVQGKTFGFGSRPPPVNVQRGKMSSSSSHFSLRRHPLTGKPEWVLEDDYRRDIARAGYADMLNDTDRNEKYFMAIKDAVQRTKKSGKRAVVLDIGAGTGLLSMMASAAGADQVYACECFHPMYLTCLKVLESNRSLINIERINVIPKRSTELKVPEDLKEKCNILVTETFDTELIGESCIETYNHAVTHLMQSQFLAVPASATVYLQLAHSPTVSKFNWLRTPYFVGDAECLGLPSVHDVQLSKLQPDVDFFNLENTNSTSTNFHQEPIFQFDFTKVTPKKRTTSVMVPTGTNSNDCDGNNKGMATAAFIYWDLDMGDGNRISCFPSWNNEEYHWREHWIQCSYYLSPSITNGETLVVSHNEFQYYFGDEEPSCKCGLHREITRSRIFQLNAFDYSVYDGIVEKSKQHEHTSVIVISDCSLLPFYLKKKVGINRVQLIGKNTFGFPSEEVAKDNQLIIIGEPYFETSLCCVNNLQFFNDVNKLGLDSTAIQVFPNKARIMGLHVRFHHFHNIREPVVSTSGFDLHDFDDLIKCSSTLELEPHPLWEYDFDVLSEEPFEIFVIDMSTTEDLKKHINSPEDSNGLVAFVEWQFGSQKMSNYDKMSQTFKKGHGQLVLFTNEAVTLRFNLNSGLNAVPEKQEHE